MSSTSQLVFDIFAKDNNTAQVFKGIEKNASGIGDALKVATGVGIAAAGLDMVKAAGDFQEGMTSLVTGAGEAKENIAQVSDGILQTARDTGESTKQLTDAEYLIGSAGYHGAEGLSVLKAAAEGAKVGNADLAVVADAVTSNLNSYGLKAGDATKVTNEMVATVAAGKMKMQDLAGSLSAVLPVAAAAGISYDQVGGAVATMTGKGVSAQQATQDLANTIRALQAPSQGAVAEMEQLGLNSVDVSQNLGQRGLTGTLDLLTQAITSKMGPAGLVIEDAFKKSKGAAEDAKVMLEKLPESIKGTAEAFESGKLSTAQWRHALKGMPAEQRELATQFGDVVLKANGFNDILKSGSPEAQTYAATLGELLGGATGLNVGLMLTGQNAATFSANVKSIGDAAADSSGDVKGWADVQEDFNTKLDKAKETFETTKIAIGTALLPVLSDLMTHVSDFLGPMIQWASHNQGAAASLIGIGAAVIGLVAAVSAIHHAVEAFTGVFKVLNLVMKENPVLLIVSLIALLVTGIIWAYNNVGWFKDGVDAAFKFIGDVINNVVSWIVNTAVPWFVQAGQNIVVGFNAVMAWFGQVGQFFASIWAAIVAGVRGFVDGFVAGFRAVIAFLQPVIAVFQAMFGAIGAAIGFYVKLWVFAFQTVMWATQQVANFLVSVWRNVSNFFGTVFATIGNFFASAWNSYIGIVSGPLNSIWQFVVTIWTNVSQFTSGVLSAIGQFISDGFNSYVNFAVSIFSGLYNGLVGAWNTVTGWASGLIGQIGGWFGDAGSILWNVGVQILQGFLGGLKSMWDNVAGFFKGLTDMIPNNKGPLERDKTLLVDNAHAIMDGFQKTLESRFPGIKASLGAFTSSMTPALAGGGSSAAYSGGPMQVNVHIGNEQLDSRMFTVAGKAIDNAAYRAGTRPSRWQ